jgi:hypothetical protein
MGHAIFILLHLVALLFAAWLLFITVPLHIIYSVQAGKAEDPERPTPETHVRCPDCKELVRKDANVCKHCGCRLTPQDVPTLKDYME